MGNFMQFIKNLSIKYKLAVIIFPSFVVMLFFCTQKIIEANALANEMEVTAKYTALALNVNSLVHELQKERGVTSVFAGSKGLKFGMEMEAQRKLADREVVAFSNTLNSLHAKGLEKPISAANDMLKKLEDARIAASGLKLTLSETVKFYSELNSQLIGIIGAMPLNINNVEIATPFMGFFAAQNYKEPMGLERAILASTFANNKFAPGMYRSLLEKVHTQEIFRKYFFTIMPDENIKTFQEFLDSDVVRKTHKLRDIAISRAATGNFGVKANDWFELQTDKINQFNDDLIKGKLTKDIQDITEKKSREADSALFWAAVVSAWLLITTLLISAYLIVLILRSLRKTTGVIHEIAQGDFTQEVNVESRDEIGELGLAVNVHVHNMHGMLEGVNSLTSRVNISANEIVAAVNEQASISTEQSASLSEITVTMEELSVSSSQIADTANSVAQMSKNMLSETDRSVASLGSLKEKMDEIEADNKNSINEIMELDRKSREIGKIMGIINNIADQTKMIAFNAAIEASSAGEAGKRFGVVAGEIRRLADNVMESTGEIQGKIDEIQKAANRLVIVSEKGAKTVRDGTAYATSTLSDLVHIVDGTKSSTESAIQISLSTQQQKTASSQVLTALKEIDQGLHHSSAALHQTSSSAITMSSMASDLQKILSKFKINQK